MKSQNLVRIPHRVTKRHTDFVNKVAKKNKTGAAVAFRKLMDWLMANYK